MIKLGREGDGDNLYFSSLCSKLSTSPPDLLVICDNSPGVKLGVNQISADAEGVGGSGQSVSLASGGALAKVSADTLPLNFEVKR